MLQKPVDQWGLEPSCLADGGEEQIHWHRVANLALHISADLQQASESSEERQRGDQCIR